jgi:hypothetical protein
VQGWRFILFTKVCVLGGEPCCFRVVVACPEVDQPGVAVGFFAGEDSSVYALPYGLFYVPPWGKDVAGLYAACVVGQFGGAAQCVKVVVLAALRCAKA